VLTPQEIEELKQQCKDYCNNADPYATLDIGRLTLTKIKDAFAIFKNLVLDARANGGGGGGGGRSASPGVSDEAAQKQIKELRSCLLQRDNVRPVSINMTGNVRSH
jgi:hypothetical protein